MQPECKKYIAWPTDVIEPIKFDSFQNWDRFQIKTLSHLLKDKICWSETIFRFCSDNIFSIQIWDNFQL